jgi:hypothetical protein
MWDDLRRVPDGLDVVAVNRAGWLYLEPLTLWISIHGGGVSRGGGLSLMGHIEKRRALGADMDFTAYGNFAEAEESGDVIRWNRPNGGGSSSLFAVRIALELGYERVVLAGVPLVGHTTICDADGSEKVDEPSAAGFGVYRGGWQKVHGEIAGHVRSMSGWTRETFGAPTAEWLNGN